LVKIGLDIGHSHDKWEKERSKGVIKADGTVFEEFNFNLAVGLKLFSLLKTDGRFDIITGQPLDNKTSEVSLRGRVKLYNTNNCEVIISLHANASESKQAKGHEVYYWQNSKDGKRLAELWDSHADSLLSATSDRGVKECVPGTWSAFFIVQYTKGICILPEHAFFTNDDDVKLLEDSDFIIRCAYVGYYALCDYFSFTYRSIYIRDELQRWEEEKGYNKLDRNGLLKIIYELTKEEVIKTGYQKMRFKDTDIHIYRSKTVPELVLGANNKRERLTEIVKQYKGAKCAINGNMFAYNGTAENGYGLIITTNGQDKKIADYYQNSNYSFVDFIAYKDGTVEISVVDKNGYDVKKLNFIQANAYWGSGSSYALKVNGEDSKLNWEKFGHVNSYTNRTMLGVDKFGLWYLIVADGGTEYDKGLRAKDQVELCNRFNLQYAVNYDGGGSSDMWLDDKIVTGNYRDERSIGTAFIIRD
jgi:N-acetylmuramoyl-L-alanine amidase